MARERPPKNPFKPRPGALPPFLAGRDKELQVVEANILLPLRDRQEPSSNAAKPAMDLERVELYAARRNELQCAEGSPLRKPLRTYADIAAAILSADGQRLHLGSVEAIVENALADEMGEAKFNADHVGTVIQRGEHTGFIRRDPLTDEFHPGIHSLLSHIAKVGAKPPLRRPTKEISG